VGGVQEDAMAVAKY